MIEVEGVTKDYGSFTAVEDLTFSVGTGEILGFLGPNGAGKSTTMRVVTGFLPPTIGEVHVCGISMVAHPEDAKRKIGYPSLTRTSKIIRSPRMLLDRSMAR